MSNNISSNFHGFDNLDDPAQLNTMLLTTTFVGGIATSAFPGVFEQGTIIVNVQNTTAMTAVGAGVVTLQCVPERGGVAQATNVCTFAAGAGAGAGPLTFTNNFQVKLSPDRGNFYLRLSCAVAPLVATTVSLAITYSNSH
jgi:hypothetical protein